MDWTSEMKQMLIAFDRRATQTLRNINETFKHDGRKFDFTNFKQTFLDMSNEQLEVTYRQFEINLRLEEEVASDVRPMNSAAGQLKRKKSIPSADVIEIVDISDDEGITESHNRTITTQFVRKQRIPSHDTSTDDELSTNSDSSVSQSSVNWLSTVIPRKTPYYPQIDDEVVYFRQGHAHYLDVVKSTNIYRNVGPKPWNRLNLRDHEFAKVIDIKYEIRPPRLCCLTLALMNNDGTLKNQRFTIKYRDITGVVDFIILKQTYDIAMNRLWTLGDRFQCMIGDIWWFGQIIGRKPYSNEFPDSLFMCFQIRYDDGEVDKMSPWDMEQIDNSRLPNEVDGVVPILTKELQMMLYQPKSDEWPRNDRDGTCRQIIAGLEKVMRLEIAEPFLVPVDLKIYPRYAFIVEYPIDLTTIKERFENNFYRRIASAQFDVRYLAKNAKEFNPKDSNVVRNSQIITDLCSRIIQDPDINVNALYDQLMAEYTAELADNPQPGTSTGTETKVSRKRTRGTAALDGSESDDWREKCRQVFEIIWNHDDSMPFQEPVDTNEYPDYLAIVGSPMDLKTVKAKLLNGNYQSRSEFLKDVRLIFINSRKYNTNTRSRIYSMTVRLRKLFEEQMEIIFKGSSLI